MVTCLVVIITYREVETQRDAAEWHVHVDKDSSSLLSNAMWDRWEIAPLSSQDWTLSGRKREGVLWRVDLPLSRNLSHD